MATAGLEGRILNEDKKPHWPQATQPIKFMLGEVVKHYKGGEYVIVGLPNDNVIEKTRECAYAYRSVTHPNGPRILRSQAEMEEHKRFSTMGRLIHAIALDADRASFHV
jgi:hypothetical protein